MKLKKLRKMKAETISKLYYNAATETNDRMVMDEFTTSEVKNCADIVKKNNVLSFENDVLKTDNSALRAEVSKLKRTLLNVLKGVRK